MIQIKSIKIKKREKINNKKKRHSLIESLFYYFININFILILEIVSLKRQ